ncbi:MAG: hypothetical protein LBQ12_06965 [Deltaproteobacteria bacterium]|jgi:hypothetical protein|nr:hypothetical protein [Deltaproteobacteria bacterium]
MSKNIKKFPDWEDVLSSACRLQSVLPGAVVVGGTAAAVHAGHRTSYDADHILADLRHHFDEVLAKLESTAGWRTARIAKPVIILGNLDGILTGVRQLIRTGPLETVEIDCNGMKLTVPSEAEILRIKSVLILKRNATRDYLDFAALYAHLGVDKAAEALVSFDGLYPQESGQSALQQLQAQLSDPMPFDLVTTDLSTYKGLSSRWRDWDNVAETLKGAAVGIFDFVCEAQNRRPPSP